MWPAGAENDATAAYRLRFPAEALIAEGADVAVSMVGPTVLWNQPWDGREPPEWVKVCGVQAPEADVVVLQRPGRRWWADLIPHIQAHGVAVVVDVDDRFDAIHPSNVARGAYVHRDGATHSERWIDAACRAADLVSATTPALVERYGHGHGILLPNYIPERYLDIRAPKRAHTIGWAGSVDTHPGDLETTGGAVEAVLARTGWSFHVVGTGVGVAQRLRLRSIPSATGWVPLAVYPDRVAELEVGIVALADTDFNASKSALKASEMAALGVAVVMSPTPDNLRLHRAGVGVLAGSPGRWRRALSALVSSSERRAELVANGRAAMEGLTYEAHCGRWMDAWAGARRKVAA